MRTIKHKDFDFEVVNIAQVPKGCEIWNIGNHAPDGYILFAFFDGDCHMIEGSRKFAVQSPHALTVSNGAIYSGWQPDEALEYVRNPSKDKFLARRATQALPYLMDLWGIKFEY